MLLRKVKQAPHENMQLFAERLLTLAEEAFAGQPGGLPVVETQLTGLFIDGLAHDFLKMKVMRDNPNTLGAAVASAIGEQNLRKRFELRTSRITRQDEPMEIGHNRSERRCYKCNKRGHLANNCKIKSVNAMTDGQHDRQQTFLNETQSAGAVGKEDTLSVFVKKLISKIDVNHNRKTRVFLP